jgi:hypothetical protein
MSLDAYFYMDMDLPEDDRNMECYCIPCFVELKKENGMFWQGSIKGYGAYAIKCHSCSKDIHVVEDDQKSD